MYSFGCLAELPSSYCKAIAADRDVIAVGEGVEKDEREGGGWIELKLIYRKDSLQFFV